MFSFNDESIGRSSSLNYTLYVTTYLLFVNNYFGYPKTKVVLIILFHSRMLNCLLTLFKTRTIIEGIVPIARS